jgi:hypothetical protein
MRRITIFFAALALALAVGTGAALAPEEAGRASSGAQERKDAPPVRAGVESVSALLPGAAVAQAQSSTQPSSVCSRLGTRVNYFSYRNEVLAFFETSQVFCFNGNRVTYASTPNTRGVITQRGAQYGWRYDGIVGGYDRYFTVNGKVRGGHRSFRQGSFTVCNAQYGCFANYKPWGRMTGYYNGRGINEAGR